MKCFECAKAKKDNGLTRLTVKDIALGFIVCNPEGPWCYAKRAMLADACDHFVRAEAGTIAKRKKFMKERLGIDLSKFGGFGL